MKNIKLSSKYLKIFLAFAVSIISLTANAQTSKTSINPLRVEGLANYQGNYITIYYGLATKASLSLSESQLTLRSVKHKHTLPIYNDSVEFPQVVLARSGFMMAYNMIVLVIHKDNQFVWINANRTVPEGESTQGSTKMIRVDALEKSEFERMKRSADPSEVINYRFGSSTAYSIIIR